MTSTNTQNRHSQLIIRIGTTNLVHCLPETCCHGLKTWQIPFAQTIALDKLDSLTPHYLCIFFKDLLDKSSEKNNRYFLSFHTKLKEQAKNFPQALIPKWLGFFGFFKQFLSPCSLYMCCWIMWQASMNHWPVCDLTQTTQCRPANETWPSPTCLLSIGTEFFLFHCQHTFASFLLLTHLKKTRSTSTGQHPFFGGCTSSGGSVSCTHSHTMWELVGDSGLCGCVHGTSFKC